MPAERFAVWGAGGHGRVVADLIRVTGNLVAGFVDRDWARVGELSGSDPAIVRWTEAEFVASLDRGYFPVPVTAAALGIGDNDLRWVAYGRLAGRPVPALIHPSASVGAEVSLAPGVVVMAGAVLNPGVSVGPAAIINSHAVVEHDCQIAEGAHVSPGAVLSGGVRIGALAWIGAGAILLPGVKVGARAIVGAGTVVLHDVAPGTIVVGNPARLLRSRDS
jgi:sugar O-acyltransferase (sialic acid O-acetyltransferase NeuD family)